MSESRTLEIRLPEDREFTGDELELLRSACEALIGQSGPVGEKVPAQVRAMAAEGWQVRTGLTWIACAERDRKYEEAVGESRGEALCRLCQLTGLHTVDGCP